MHGDNIGNVVQFMEREYPQRFQAVLDRIAEKIPGIDQSTRREPVTTGYCCGSMTRDFRIPSMPSRYPTGR